jgi:hypothetical protein
VQPGEGALKRALIIGLALAGGRVLFGAFIAAMAALAPESHMLVVMDLPTIAVYTLFATFAPVTITDAFDVMFHTIGVATWFIVGFGIGLLVGLSRPLAPPDASA